MSNIAYLTAAIREKLNKIKNSADAQAAFQDPLKFNLVCGLAELIAKRLEDRESKLWDFTMTAYIAVDDIRIGNYFSQNDRDVLTHYPMLLTIDNNDYDFLNESVRCLAKLIFNLPSLADTPRKSEIQNFPQKFLLNIMEKTRIE